MAPVEPIWDVRFATDAEVDLVSFAKHDRKDDITQQYLQRFDADEGVLYVGRDITPGRMSYELRRLRLHGLIERLPNAMSSCASGGKRDVGVWASGL